MNVEQRLKIRQIHKYASGHLLSFNECAQYNFAVPVIHFPPVIIMLQLRT
jgi:hypothetical protein